MAFIQLYIVHLSLLRSSGLFTPLRSSVTCQDQFFTVGSQPAVTSHHTATVTVHIVLYYVKQNAQAWTGLGPEHGGDFILWLCVACVWPVCGLCVACVWPVCGLCLACVWPVFGLCVGTVWVVCGQ